MTFTRAKQRAIFTLCQELGLSVSWIENLITPVGVRCVNLCG